MQDTYIPETNYVPREHGVAAILSFLFMVIIIIIIIIIKANDFKGQKNTKDPVGGYTLPHLNSKLVPLKYGGWLV